MSELVWDSDLAVWVFGETPTHFIHIMPMIFNHRVVLTPKSDTTGYDVGWCFPSLDHAVQACTEWDPATQPEPRNYIKRVGIPLETN